MTWPLVWVQIVAGLRKFSLVLSWSFSTISKFEWRIRNMSNLNFITAYPELVLCVHVVFLIWAFSKLLRAKGRYGQQELARAGAGSTCKRLISSPSPVLSLFCLFICWWTLRLFSPLGYVFSPLGSWAWSRCEHLHTGARVPAFSSFACIPESGIAGSHGN